jgi:hypothetical protein
MTSAAAAALTLCQHASLLGFPQLGLLSWVHFRRLILLSGYGVRCYAHRIQVICIRKDLLLYMHTVFRFADPCQSHTWLSLLY